MTWGASVTEAKVPLGADPNVMARSLAGAPISVRFHIEVPQIKLQDADPLVLETRRYNCHCSERASVVMLIQTAADVGNRESTRPGGTARTHISLAIDLGPTRHGVSAVRAVTG